MLALALVATAGVVVLGGCGGEGEDASSAKSTITPGGATAPGAPAQEAEAPSREARGGEASIEDFGSEAEGSEREAILSVFSGYLDAIATEDHVGACADLATPTRESLARFAGEGAKGDCAASLDALLSPTAPQIARQQANGEVTRVRAEGDRAFVVFKAPGAELFQQTMVEESGEWKAAAVIAAVLVPEL